MQDINAEIIAHVYVGPIFKQKLYNTDISSKRCEVQGCKPIIFSLSINPQLDLSFSENIFNSFN